MFQTYSKARFVYIQIWEQNLFKGQLASNQKRYNEHTTLQVREILALDPVLTFERTQ